MLFLRQTGVIHCNYSMFSGKTAGSCVSQPSVSVISYSALCEQALALHYITAHKVLLLIVEFKLHSALLWCFSSPIRSIKL